MSWKLLLFYSPYAYILSFIKNKQNLIMTKSTAFVWLSVVALFTQSFKPVEPFQSPIVAQAAGNSFV